jgi:hypothetical protein
LGAPFDETRRHPANDAVYIFSINRNDSLEELSVTHSQVIAEIDERGLHLLFPAHQSASVNAKTPDNDRQVFGIFGVTDGARTHDNGNHNPGLYQLSYGHRRCCNIAYKKLF